MSRKKIHRLDLRKKIIKAASLPLGESTKGYFSRVQLLELLLFIESQKERIEKLQEAINVKRPNEETQNN